MARPAIATAVEACYDAVFDTALWPDALQTVAGTFGASSCVIRTWDDAHPFAADRRRYRKVVAPDSAGHADFTALWLERIEGAPDPHIDRPRLLAKPPISFIVEDEITTPTERRLLPYYQEIARPGHREWYAAVEFPVGQRKWSLALFREAGKGPFEPNDGRRAIRIAPHLSRVIAATEKLSNVSLGRGLSALDVVGCPAVLIDHQGRITRLNHCAEPLFDADGLRLRHSRMHAQDRASDARLQALIANGNRWSAGSCIVERDGYPWLLVQTLPMTRFGHDLFDGGHTLIYFSNLEAHGTPSQRHLRLAFDLTPAEARLAGALVGGMGLAAASAKLGISRETARTQLRAIFSKTGTQRQAELAALLSRLPGRFS